MWPQVTERRGGEQSVVAILKGTNHEQMPSISMTEMHQEMLVKEKTLGLFRNPNVKIRS